MKLSFAFLAAFVAFASAGESVIPAFGKGPLHDDIHYFLEMIPMEEVSTIVLQYAAEDAEFQEVVSYLMSQDFKDLVVYFQSIPEVLNFITYLDDNGIYAYEITNKFNSFLGLAAVKRPGTMAAKTTTGGLAGLFNSVKDLINYDDFIHGYVYKMKTSPAFADLVDHLKSDNTQGIVDKLYTNDHFLTVHAALTTKGVNIRLIEDIIYVVLGISFPTQEPSQLAEHYSSSRSQLAADLQEFVDLAITPEVLQVLATYVFEDEEVQKALEYAFSEEFHQMVREVEALKEYQDLVIYMHNAGLDVFELIQRFHKFVGMEDYVPPSVGQVVNPKYHSLRYAKTGGIRGLVDDITALLPVDELRALFELKMKTSKAFADFIAHMNSDEFQKIVDSFYNHEIYLELVRKGREAGLDVDALAELLHLLFGLNFPEKLMR